MKKLILLIVLPILLMASIDTLKLVREDYLGTYYEFWTDSTEIASDDTAYWENPVKVGLFDIDGLRILHGDSLRLEYRFGADTTNLGRYTWDWRVDTTCTGVDSVYTTSLLYNAYYDIWCWIRAINIKSAAVNPVIEWKLRK